MFWQEIKEGVRLRIQLSPRSSQEGVGGLHGDALKVRVNAPPVDGKANEALTRFMAKKLGLPRQAVELVSGQTSKSKVLLIKGLSPAEIVNRLGLD